MSDATPTPTPTTKPKSPILKIVLLVGLLLVVGVAVSTYLFGGTALDGIVRSTIEKVGTSTLGVRTTLAKAHIDLTGGRATLRDLRIDNAPGFKADRFMSISGTDVGLNIGSVRTDTIELTHVKLDGIVVNLEGSPGSMNYNAILDKLKTEEAKPAAKEGKKFIIRTLELTNVKAIVTVSPLPAVTVPIDRIELKDVGKDGLSATELTQAVVQSVLQAVASNGGGLLPKDMLGDLTQHLSGLQDLGIDALSDMQKQLESTFGGAIDDAGKTVKGLFDSIIPPSEKKKEGK